MTVKQQLSLEIEKASPEVLAQALAFIQFLKKQRSGKINKLDKRHFLEDVIGILDQESGAELDAIVNREFQQIEGEW